VSVLRDEEDGGNVTAFVMRVRPLRAKIPRPTPAGNHPAHPWQPGVHGARRSPAELRMQGILCARTLARSSAPGRLAPLVAIATRETRLRPVRARPAHRCVVQRSRFTGRHQVVEFYTNIPTPPRATIHTPHVRAHSPLTERNPVDRPQLAMNGRRGTPVDAQTFRLSPPATFRSARMRAGALTQGAEPSSARSPRRFSLPLPLALAILRPPT
jgi:hypothetical protein